MTSPIHNAGKKHTVVAGVHDDLLQLIRDAKLRPGDRFETEPRLAEQLGVSRSSIREAFKLLESEGVVTAIQGQGRFVTSVSSLGVDRPMSRFESLSEMLGRLGYEVTTLVLHVSTDIASESEGIALGIERGAPVIRLVRLRLGDGRPMVLNMNTIPHSLLPGDPHYRDWSASLTKSLAQNGHRVSFSSARISAASLPTDVEERYNLGGLGPWLIVRETAIDVAGRRVFVGEDYHTSEISFSVLRHR